MNRYQFCFDKYQARLNAVGYKIVDINATLMGELRVLRVRSLGGTEEYDVDATDDKINLFIEEMRKRRKECAANVLYDELYTWKYDKIHTGNFVSGAFEPRCIQRRGTATIVHWKDGTQTKIVRQTGTEDAGLFAAFCIALSKKVFGTKTNLERAIQDADEERQNAAIEEAKLAVKKRHAEQMERQRKRALKRRLRLECRRIGREEECWKMNLKQMNQEVTKLISRGI